MENPFYSKPSICPVCKKGASFLFVENYKNDKLWSLYECNLCNVQFWLPLIIPQGVTYEDDVTYNGKSDILSRTNARKIVDGYWQVGQFLKDFSKDNRKDKKILDVACGTGEFIFVAKELGYGIEGVDFNKNAINLARERFGLNEVFVADVFSFLEEKKETYDVITAFEIIEHVSDPDRFLSLIHGALKKGGILVLSTPNRDRNWGRISSASESWDFPYQHLLRWNSCSLVKYIEGRGFKKEKIKEELPTDWFVYRLRALVGKFLSKPSEKNPRTVSERLRDGFGFSRYHGLRRCLVFLFKIPSFVMMFFGFKGVHIYGRFRKI